MKTVNRKISIPNGSRNEIEVLDKDSKKHLVYATIIGVVLYLCVLAVFGVR